MRASSSSRDASYKAGSLYRHRGKVRKRDIHEYGTEGAGETALAVEESADVDTGKAPAIDVEPVGREPSKDHRGPDKLMTG